MKFDIKKLNVFYGIEAGTWDIVDVEQQKNEDQLTFNKDYDIFLNFDKNSFEQKITKKDKIEKTLWSINDKIEWFMDFWITDRWNVDIEDWQDIQYLKKVVWEINNTIKEYISWQRKAKNDLNKKMNSFIDKTDNKEKGKKLKWFLSKLEGRKKETTLDKVASSIPWTDRLKNNAEGRLNNTERMSDSA